MFRAVSHQLYGTESRHLDIRHSLNHFISQNQSKYEEYWIDSTASYSSHLQLMRNPGSWGTELELKAFSDYLSMPVFVCSPDGLTGGRSIPRQPQSDTCIGKLPTLPFTLNHIEIAHSSTRGHYDSVIPYYSSTVSSFLSPPTFRLSCSILVNRIV